MLGSTKSENLSAASEREEGVQPVEGMAQTKVHGHETIQC